MYAIPWVMAYLVIVLPLQFAWSLPSWWARVGLTLAYFWAGWSFLVGEPIQNFLIRSAQGH
jgi:hypothetical protein